MGELIAGILVALIGAYATIEAARIQAGTNAPEPLWRCVTEVCKRHKAAVVAVSVIALSLTAWGCWREFYKEPEPVPLNENPVLHRDIGDRNFELERFEEALLEYQNAVDIEPGEALNHDSKARALAKLGRYEEALDESIMAVALDSNVGQYHYNEGITIYYLERYSDAEKEFEKAIQLQPKQADYHNGLALTLFRMERYEEALEEIQMAVKLEPDNAKFHNNLGVTLNTMGCREEALEEIRLAVKLEPNNVLFLENLLSGIDIDSMMFAYAPDGNSSKRHSGRLDVVPLGEAEAALQKLEELLRQKAEE